MRRTPTILAAVLCATFSSGCAIDPKTGQPSVKETFASDDPCSDNARNTGALIGAIAGAILGNQVEKSNKGRLLGAAAGALVGGFIGSDMDRRRCELARIAKKYDLQIETVPLTKEGTAVVTSSPGTKEATGQETTGLAVSIRDTDGQSSHFESGSDQLTPRAQEYFAAIARQYKPRHQAATITDPKQRAQFLEAAATRHLFLAGHTDDAGSSKYNAELSERRAKAVARYLAEQGVPDQYLYYQGAGETHPIADNATEEGRAKNRRVDIVELADEANFRKYLAARQVHHEYFRPQAATVAAAAPEKARAAKQPVVKSSRKESQAAARDADSARGFIDFGGIPYTEREATIDAGKMLEEGGFSIFPKAHAEKPAVVTSCRYDRPRMAGNIRSLVDGRPYTTNEHLPGLHGRTWFDLIGGNLVVLNKVSVLRGGATPDGLPEFKVYRKFDPAKRNSAVAEINVTPQVNAYAGSKGLLYRIFLNGEGGVRCADVLFPSSAPFQARAGRLIYAGTQGDLVARFTPRIQD